MPSLGEYLDNVLAQAIGRVVTAASSLGLTVLVARELGVAAYGQFAYLLVFLAAAIGIAEFGTNSVLARDIAIHDDLAGYWGNFLLVRLGLSVVVALLALPVAWHTSPELAGYLVPCLLALPVLASRFFEPVFQVFRRPWYSTATSCLYGAVLLPGAWLALVAGAGLGAIIAVYVAANAVYTIAALQLSGRLLRPRLVWSRRVAGRLMRSAAPVGAGSLISVVNSRADVFLLNHLRSGYDVGIYSAAYRVLEFAGVVAIVLMNPSIQIFSLTAARDREQLRVTFGHVLVGLGCVTLPVAILARPLAGPLVVAVFGAAFAPAAVVLAVLAWVGVTVFFFLFAFSLCVAIDSVNVATVLIGVAALLNLLLNALWVPRYGYVGTAWARLSSDLVLTLGMLAYVQLRIGRIVEAGAWLRILGLCSALWAFLATAAPRLGALGPVIGALLYAGGVLGLRAFPVELLRLGRPSQDA
jgi:O-antigen/teichoic acid export membrane protein